MLPRGDLWRVATLNIWNRSGPWERRLPLFVTHLTVQAHLTTARCVQVRALAAHVAALAPIGEPPPVVVGDFNAEPDADEIRFLRGLTALGGESVYFADAWLATGAAGPGYTWDRRNDYALAQ